MARLLRSQPPQPRYSSQELPPPTPPFAPISVNLATGLLTQQRRAQERFPRQGWEQQSSFEASSAPTSQTVRTADAFTSTGGSTTFGTATSFAIGVAQPFPNVRGRVSAVTGFFDAIGAPSDQVVAQLQTDNGGLPSGVVLASSAPVTIGAFPPAEYLFTFADQPEVSQVVWVVFQRTGALSNTSNYRCYRSVVIDANGDSADQNAPSTAWTLESFTLLASVTFTPFALQLHQQRRFLGPRPPLVINPLPSQQQQTVAVANTAVIASRRSPLRRVHATNLSPLAASASTFVAPPVSVNCVSSDRLAHRVRRQPPQPTLAPPTALQVFSGPATRLLTNQRSQRLSAYKLGSPVVVSYPAAVETTLAVTTVRTRPRTTRGLLFPPILASGFVGPPLSINAVQRDRAPRFPLQGWDGGVTQDGTTPTTTPILDNFNRADGAPGSPWKELNLGTTVADFVIQSNQLHATAASGSAHIAYFSSVVGNSDQEAFLTVNTKPTATDKYLGLVVRMNDPGDNASAWNAYIGRYDVSTGNVELLRVASASASVVATAARTLVNGDQLSLRIVGRTLSFYCTPSGGSRTLIVSYTDPSPISNSGSPGVYGSGSAGDWLIDDFGGGTLVAVGQQGNPSRLLGPRPPLVIAPAALPPDGPQVNLSPGDTFGRKHRRTTSRLPLVVGSPSAFIASPLNVNCVSPDRLAHRVRRMPSQVALAPPTTLQTFSVGKPSLVRIRPRQTVKALFPPTIVRTPSIEQREQTITVALVKTRPRHTVWSLPTVIGPSTSPTDTTVLVALVRTRPRPTSRFLLPPSTLEPESVALQERTPRVVLTHTRPRPTRRFFIAPTVVRVPSVEAREQTIFTALVHTRPRPTSRRLSPPTALRVFAGSAVTLAHTRPRPTRHVLAAPTAVRTPSVEQREQTIAVALVRTRPRRTSYSLRQPTALQVFAAGKPALVRTRPRPTDHALYQPTVIRVPSVEQQEDTIRVTLVSLRAAQRRQYVHALTAISYPQTSEIQIMLARIRPRPTRRFLTAVSYPATSEISVTTVRTRPRPTTTFIQPPTVLQTFAAGRPALVATRPRPTRHLLTPPTVVRVPSVEQQEDTIRVATVRTRPRPTLTFLVPPVVRTFPPVVTTLAVTTVAVRTRVEQRRHTVEHFLRPPTVVIPLPTLRVQTITVTVVHTRPRPTSRNLGKPTVLQTFRAAATPLVRARPRPTRYFLGEPTVVRVPVVEQAQRTIRVALVETRPRPKAAVLRPPTALRVFAGPTVETVAVRAAQRRRTTSFLTDIRYEQTGQITTHVVATRPRPTTSFIQPPTVLREFFGPVEVEVAVKIPVEQPRRPLRYRLSPPIFRAPVETRIRVTLTRTRPQPTKAALAAPTVVAARFVETRRIVSLAPARRPATRTRLAAPTVVAVTPPPRQQTLAPARRPAVRSRLAPPTVIRTPPIPTIRSLAPARRPATRSLLAPPAVVAPPPPPVAVHIPVILTATQTRARFRIGRHALPPVLPPPGLAGIPANTGYAVPGATSDGESIPGATSDGHTVPGAASEGRSIPVAESDGKAVPGAATTEGLT